MRLSGNMVECQRSKFYFYVLWINLNLRSIWYLITNKYVLNSNRPGGHNIYRWDHRFTTVQPQVPYPLKTLSQKVPVTTLPRLFKERGEGECWDSDPRTKVPRGNRVPCRKLAPLSGVYPVDRADWDFSYIVSLIPDGTRSGTLPDCLSFRTRPYPLSGDLCVWTRLWIRSRVFSDP